MADLADRLRREGLVVREDVGAGTPKIDLVLADPADPSRYLVAVQGDGPGYAALNGTRERDRLWVEQLRRLGWRHLRIFSTDLYRDPAREVARVLAAMRDDHTEDGADAHEGPGAAVDQNDGETRASRRAHKKRRRSLRRSSADQTVDDTDAGWGERVDESAHDRWLQEQRPPHWD